jgi:hypothetical protein
MNKFRACITPSHYIARLDIIKTILCENIDIIIENINLLNVSNEFHKFINHVSIIKNNCNILQLIDYIRENCPPINNFIKKENIAKWSSLDYQNMIFESSDYGYHITHRKQMYSNLPSNGFEHYCNSFNKSTHHFAMMPNKVGEKNVAEDEDPTVVHIEHINKRTSLESDLSGLDILATVANMKIIATPTIDIHTTTNTTTQLLINIPRVGKSAFKPYKNKCKYKDLPALMPICLTGFKQPSNRYGTVIVLK